MRNCPELKFPLHTEKLLFLLKVGFQLSEKFEEKSFLKLESWSGVKAISRNLLRYAPRGDSYCKKKQVETE
jgi:hypothetical protein